MSRTAFHFLFLALLVIVLATGCAPPAAIDAAPPANVTEPAAAEEEPAEDEPPAEGPSEAEAEPAEDPAEAAMPWEQPAVPGGVNVIPVKNPLYNEDDPVLYDSGYEEDNASCLVCHIDFEKEEIVAVHLEADITCMACHGDSEVHRSDEYNIIRPDVIWGRAQMDVFCKQCHPKHKKPSKVEEFLAEWEGKRRENGRWVLADSVCTDCHGNHAIVPGEGEFK